VYSTRLQVLAHLVGKGPAVEIALLRRNYRKLLGVRRLEIQALRQLRPVPGAYVATVIPTIGRESLRAAVASALAQPVRDHRVIVVRDGPCDIPTLPVDDRLHVITPPTKLSSPGALRNIGMSAIASDFVAFLDDDNTWDITHLSTALNALHCAGATISYAGCRRLAPAGDTLDNIGRPWRRRDLLSENWVDTSAIVVRRKHRYRWSRYPYGTRTPYSFGEDWAYLFWHSVYSRVVFTGATTVNYFVPDARLPYVRCSTSQAPS
jgi:glycosyltransferase involved in cell wall biosynthesis